MTQLAFAFEEVWLRAALNNHIDELFISVRAEREMAEFGITLPEVLCLLREGSVTESEKVEIGAELIVTGMNCDEELLWACVHIDTDMIRIEILSLGRP